jgi:hypothetical protein
MKLWLASFVAAALLTAGTAIAADAPAKPVVLQAKQGEVTFKHETHKAQKCTTCHADEKGGKIEALSDKNKAHGLCADCHKKEAKGPAKCAECHKKA